MSESRNIFYPQAEITTVLVPVTRGCSFNQCAFCSMYKEEAYEEVMLQEIEFELMNGETYTERVFLTGADPLSVGYEKMMRILKLIQKYYPYCGCVAMYAAVRTINNYTVEELKQLHAAGLRLLYIGFESGSDEVLKSIRKGHTVKTAIAVGKKLNEARLPFNAIVMYGIAGEGNSEENAKKTAEMLNQFSASKIITMNLTVFASTELAKMEQEGMFVQAGIKEKISEVRILLENLDVKKRTEFDTTHATNIIKLLGTLPDEKEILLEKIKNSTMKKLKDDKK